MSKYNERNNSWIRNSERIVCNESIQLGLRSMGSSSVVKVVITESSQRDGVTVNWIAPPLNTRFSHGIGGKGPCRKHFAPFYLPKKMSAVGVEIDSPQLGGKSRLEKTSFNLFECADYIIKEIKIMEGIAKMTSSSLPAMPPNINMAADTTSLQCKL